MLHASLFCPSCGATLDTRGICTHCDAEVRGQAAGLDLGSAPIADAIARGLDLYAILGLTPAAQDQELVLRYRRLRVRFPDHPGQLQPTAARRLALIEQAGTVLCNPASRAQYDRLAAGAARGGLQTRRCEQCGGPLAHTDDQCPWCGTTLPRAARAPAQPPERPRATIEPLDYYALIGYAPPAAESHDEMSRRYGQRSIAPRESQIDAAIEQAALERLRSTLLNSALSAEQREQQASEIEIARRILGDERRRRQYDAILDALRSGRYSAQHVELFALLRDEVLSELRSERGESSSVDTAALLRQAQGYLRLGLHREALEALTSVLSSDPEQIEAHQAMLAAVLGSDDLLGLGDYLLRRAEESLLALERLAPPADAAQLALLRGLRARDRGDLNEADVFLQQALALNPQLGAAWRVRAAVAMARGEAAQAIEHARQALAQHSNDERMLIIVTGACLRLRRRREAEDSAAAVARLRGPEWNAARVLRDEFGVG